jgi:hypothetical protein
VCNVNCARAHPFSHNRLKRAQFFRDDASPLAAHALLSFQQPRAASALVAA